MSALAKRDFKPAIQLSVHTRHSRRARRSLACVESRRLPADDEARTGIDHHIGRFCLSFFYVSLIVLEHRPINHFGITSLATTHRPHRYPALGVVGWGRGLWPFSEAQRLSLMLRIRIGRRRWAYRARSRVASAHLLVTPPAAGRSSGQARG